MYRAQKTAFTLVELLTVMAILSIIMALLLVAINRSRESARMIDCSNNVKQLTASILNFESTFKRLPAGAVSCSDPLKTAGTQTGNVCSGPNWLVSILPFVERNDIWEKVVECLETEWSVCDDCEHRPWEVGREVPSFLLCPSSPRVKHHSSHITQLEWIGKGNYAACFGSWKYFFSIEGGPHELSGVVGLPLQPGNDGPRWRNSIGGFSVIRLEQRGFGMDSPEDVGTWKIANRGVPLRRIRDGQSKTIAVSELRISAISDDIRGAWTAPAMGAASFTAYHGPNGTQGDSAYSEHTIESGDRYFGCANAHNEKDDVCSFEEQNGNHWVSAKSEHPGGVVVGRFDGSVTFVSNITSLRVWQSLASRDGQ